MGLGKLSCSRKTTFSTKCWISHCSGPRTNTIQSWVNPSVVGFLRSWARCPSSNLTWTVHWREREASPGQRRAQSREPQAVTPRCPQSSVGAGHRRRQDSPATGASTHKNAKSLPVLTADRTRRERLVRPSLPSLPTGGPLLPPVLALILRPAGRPARVPPASPAHSYLGTAAPASGALSLGSSTAGSFLSLKSRLECHLLWEDPTPTRATRSESTHHHPRHAVSHPMFSASVTAGAHRLTIWWLCSDV